MKGLDGSVEIVMTLFTTNSAQTFVTKTQTTFFRVECSITTMLWTETMIIAVPLLRNAHHTGIHILILDKIQITTPCTIFILINILLFSMTIPKHKVLSRRNMPNLNSVFRNALCPRSNWRMSPNMRANYLFLLWTATLKIALNTNWWLTYLALIMFQVTVMKQSISRWVLPLLQPHTRLLRQTPKVWAWSFMRIAL